MGTYAWNIHHTKILPAKSLTRQRHPAAARPPAQSSQAPEYSKNLMNNYFCYVFLSVDKLVSEDARTMADVKSMVYQLYSTLHVEQHQLEKEKDLRKELEDLQVEIEPLEKVNSIQIMNVYECNGTNIFMRWKMKCSIQRGEAELNGTFHLSPNKNICSIAQMRKH